MLHNTLPNYMTNKVWLRLAAKLRSMALEEALVLRCVRATITNGFWHTPMAQYHVLDSKSANSLLELCDVLLDDTD